MNDPAVKSLKPVQSSMFSAVGFDETHWTLTVAFHSGLILSYQQIPPELYEEFIAAESLGKFYNANIKQKFESLVEQEAHKAEKPLVVDGKPVAADADLSVPPSDAGNITVETLQHGYAADAKPQRTSKIDGQPLGGRVNPPTASPSWDEVGSKASNPDATPLKFSAENPPSDGPILADCYVHMAKTEHWKRPDGSLVCVECHPPASQKPQEASQALAAAPALLEPLEAPKTPLEAISLLTDNDALIQATIKQNKEIAAEAMALTVTDPASYTVAGERLKFLAEVKDRATRFLDPIRAILLKPYQLAQQRLKEATEPVDTALVHVKRQRLTWSEEQERKRVAEEQRRNREEAERAERERQERSQQLTLGAVDEALASGDEATAEKLLAEPINATPVYVPPVHVESAVPVVAGVSRRSKWVAEVTSFEDLVLDIAQGICSTRDNRGLGGHAPITFLKVDQTALNQSAKSQRQAMSYPGVKAFDEGSESVRRKK